ncbi:IPExxxVDY family protein [Christiangramia sabulilitoris]|uniref:IPExxxVDY family protein n=1 Tax=Christiangramia sabulilitoris TaxID=2583991 RepID=A0A550I904_9FLAO|nr:IPExxxVDY family protein [Christiangramia sabulilitoris]TRO67454.1 IPExxxVDY family protein [Christiangramia sabulilitoris]
MQSHKILEVEDDNFNLIAIYSSLEGYKLAYFLNKHLKIKLEREPRDIDFNHTEYDAFYALFSHKDPNSYYSLDLVCNKFKGKPKKILSSGSLFAEEELSPQEVYLIPEYDKVDYFLKISEEIQPREFMKVLNKIGQIPGVQAAYAIDVDNLKSKQNLIFE